MSVSERIRIARKKRGLTQEELGKLLNVTQATVQQYECGKRNPKIETLQKIAAALDIDVNYLRDGSHSAAKILGDNITSGEHGRALFDNIYVSEPIQGEDNSFTINVTVNGSNMTANDLTTALGVIFESARDNNISITVLSELAAAAATTVAVLNEKYKSSKDGDSDAT